MLLAFAVLALAGPVGARTQGRTTACKSNLRNLGTALEMYSSDHDFRYPRGLADLTPNYLKSIPTCPAGSPRYDYQHAENPDAYTVCCVGQVHPEVMGPFDPTYTSRDGLVDKHRGPSLTADEAKRVRARQRREKIDDFLYTFVNFYLPIALVVGALMAVGLFLRGRGSPNE